MEDNQSNQKESNEFVLSTPEGAVIQKEVVIPICETHTKDNWFTHVGYLDNKDGTVTCQRCPWGCQLPGYMRCYEGKIVDLRSVSSG